MDYRSAAVDAANRYGIPVDLFLAQIGAESSFDPKAISHAGAIGLAQLMPGTAAELGVDPSDPLQNLDGGARYLRQQYDKFGDWRLALAAYNAGPGAVEKYGGVPPYEETQNYVNKLAGYGSASGPATPYQMADPNALAGMAAPSMPQPEPVNPLVMRPEPPKFGRLDPAMFMNRRSFV